MTDPTSNCLFCRILRGEIPAKKVYEDEHVFAFEDIESEGSHARADHPEETFCGIERSAG